MEISALLDQKNDFHDTLHTKHCFMSCPENSILSKFMSLSIYLVKSFYGLVLYLNDFCLFVCFLYLWCCAIIWGP